MLQSVLGAIGNLPLPLPCLPRTNAADAPIAPSAVYLAGPIVGETYSEQAETILASLGCTTINPMRGKEELQHLNRPISLNENYSPYSLFLVMRSTSLLIGFPNGYKPSFGTAFECAYMRHIPIILWLPSKSPIHPFLTTTSSLYQACSMAKLLSNSTQPKILK